MPDSSPSGIDRVERLNERPVLGIMYRTSRFIVELGITALLLAAVIVVIFSFTSLFQIVSHLARGGFVFEEMATYLAVSMTEIIDLTLLGIVLIIIALGVYQLFIDPTLELPKWLETHRIETLEERLLAVVVVLLPVLFVGHVATWDGGIGIIGLGIAIASVMAAIMYVISTMARTMKTVADLEAQPPDVKEKMS
ncbi:MAG TPA: YqhA family protein [Methanomicrobiales archaeon]|nr:YqhA family protein [Methanomicrobiales archaeon]